MVSEKAKIIKELKSNLISRLSLNRDEIRSMNKRSTEKQIEFDKKSEPFLLDPTIQLLNSFFRKKGFSTKFEYYHSHYPFNYTQFYKDLTQEAYFVRIGRTDDSYVGIQILSDGEFHHEYICLGIPH